MKFSINCKGKLVYLDSPKIMGILNLTPDSFSDGGKFNNEASALLQVEKMIEHGADIIDIGAQSTRPSSKYLSAEEEINRLKNILPKIRKEFSEIIISLDTFHSEVVNFGYEEGIDIVNDISGGEYDMQMFAVVSKTQLPYILMHSNPSYEEMHQPKACDDIILHLNSYFSEKISNLVELGIKDIILDPGFGFGKTIEQQQQIANELEHIMFSQYPLLVGISKKSFIYKPLNKTPHDVNKETQNLHLKMLKKGAKILRVHDVRSAYETILNFQKYSK